MQNRIFFVCKCGTLRGVGNFRVNSWKKLPNFVTTKFPVKKTLWWWWSQTPNQIFVDTKNGAKISSISRQKLPRAFTRWSRGLSVPTLQVHLITQLLFAGISHIVLYMHNILLIYIYQSFFYLSEMKWL